MRCLQCLTSSSPKTSFNPNTTAVAVEFIHDSPRDSAIVDANTGRTLYNVATDKRLTHNTTRLTTADGRVVGVWEHKTFDSDQVTFWGRTSKVSEWLPKKGTFSR